MLDHGHDRRPTMVAVRSVHAIRAIDAGRAILALRPRHPVMPIGSRRPGLACHALWSRRPGRPHRPGLSPLPRVSCGAWLPVHARGSGIAFRAGHSRHSGLPIAAVPPDAAREAVTPLDRERRQNVNGYARAGRRGKVDVNVFVALHALTERRRSTSHSAMR